MLRKVILFLTIWFPLLSHADTGQASSFSEVLKSKIRMVQHMALNPVLVQAIGRRGEVAPSAGETDTEDTLVLLQIPLEPQHVLVMKQFVDRNASFTEIRLADNKGFEVSSYTATKSEMDAEMLDKALIEGVSRVFVGPLTVDESTRAISTYVSAPVMDRDKNVGVLVVGVRLGGSSSSVIN